MKKLVMNFFDIEVDLDNFNMIEVQIENKQLFYDILNSFLLEELNLKYLSIVDDNMKKIDIYDCVDFVYSLLVMNVNDKKNINVLNRQIKRMFNNELSEKCIKINKELYDLSKYIEFEYPLDVYSDILLKEEDLLKYLNIKIKEKEGNILERIVNYIDVTYQLRDINVFTFVNLGDYLEDDQINLLVKEAMYRKITIITINNHDNFINNSNFIKRICDKDVCLLK